MVEVTDYKFDDESSSSQDQDENESEEEGECSSSEKSGSRSDSDSYSDIKFSKQRVDAPKPNPLDAFRYVKYPNQTRIEASF